MLTLAEQQKREILKTALKTNIEAAEEIAKQIKIRDLSGLIVIDFIDMYEMRNNRQVERKMKELLKKDRARVQVSRISQFGLLEMSRQRLRQSFIQWKTELSNESMALRILYKIRETINNKKFKNIEIRLNSSISKFLHNNCQSEIDEIKDVSKVTLSFIIDEDLENNEINLKEIKLTDQAKKEKKKKIVKKKKKISLNVKDAADKSKETKNKNEPLNKNSSLKEIKNKKTGWWQK